MIVPPPLGPVAHPAHLLLDDRRVPHRRAAQLAAPRVDSGGPARVGHGYRAVTELCYRAL